MFGPHAAGAGFAVRSVASSRAVSAYTRRR
jgi:hypothetical protein